MNHHHHNPHNTESETPSRYPVITPNPTTSTSITHSGLTAEWDTATATDATVISILLTDNDRQVLTSIPQPVREASSLIKLDVQDWGQWLTPTRQLVSKKSALYDALEHDLKLFDTAPDSEKTMRVSRSFEESHLVLTQPPSSTMCHIWYSCGNKELHEGTTLMFENLEPTHTTSISTTGYTITDGTLEPGEYWVGDLTTLINPASPLPVESMVLDTIAKVGAAEPRLGGINLTYEGKEVSFLVDKPSFPGDMYVRISDDTVVDTSGLVVEVDTYMVVMPVIEVTVPDDNVRRHLQDNGVFLTFKEPVSVSNAVCLHFFNKDGSHIVAEVM